MRQLQPLGPGATQTPASFPLPKWKVCISSAGCTDCITCLIYLGILRVLPCCSTYGPCKAPRAVQFLISLSSEWIFSECLWFSSICPLIGVIMMVMVIIVSGHKVACCPPLKASSLFQVNTVIWDYVLRSSFLYETLHSINT